MPDYILIEYDPRFNIVVFVDGLAGNRIDENRLIPRKALSQTARRAGWVGCTINIAGLDRMKVRIVQPDGLDRRAVRSQWKQV
jgi:hypothetical protein